MKELILGDITASEQLARAFGEQIQPKGCYDNVAHIVLALPGLQQMYPGIEVAFGGVQIFPEEPEAGLYAKHVFFIQDGKAIDPTLGMQGKMTKETHFLALMIYDIEEYRLLLSEYQETSPSHILRALDQKGLSLMQQNIVLVG